MARSTKKKTGDRPGQADPAAPLDGAELLAAARPVLDELRDGLSRRAADPRVEAALRARFRPCLPARLEAEYLADVLTSERDARAAVACPDGGT